jgi:hypothetical protein
MVVIADSEHMILETNFSIMQFHKDNPISTRCEGQTSASKRSFWRLNSIELEVHFDDQMPFPLKHDMAEHTHTHMYKRNMKLTASHQ